MARNRGCVSFHLTLHFHACTLAFPDPSSVPLGVRILPPALGRTVNAARIPVSFSFPGVWERWARLLAVMAPSGPAHINQSHINQGQGRNR